MTFYREMGKPFARVLDNYSREVPSASSPRHFFAEVEVLCKSCLAKSHREVAESNHKVIQEIYEAPTLWLKALNNISTD